MLSPILVELLLNSGNFFTKFWNLGDTILHNELNLKKNYNNNFMHIVAECIHITVYLIGSQAKAQLTVMKNKHAVGSRDTFWTLSHHMQSMLWELMQQEEGCVPLKSSYSAVQTSTLSNLCVADKTFRMPCCFCQLPYFSTTSAVPL